MNILATLKGKVGGIPVWAIALLVTGGAFYFLKKKGSAAPSTTDQTAGNFGTPGTIPYSGGTSFITITQPSPTPTTPTAVKSSGPATVKNTPPSVTPKPFVYRVRQGDTFASIAKRYGLAPSQLLQYNLSTGPKGANRSTSAISALAARGEKVSGPGETLVIPKRGTVYSGGY